MPTGSGVVGTAWRYYFALRLANGAPRLASAAAVTATVRNPANTASDLPAVTEVAGGQYFIDISAAFTTLHGAGQYGVLLEVTTGNLDTFSESITFETVGPAGIPGLVWEELLAAHVTAGTFGLFVQQIPNSVWTEPLGFGLFAAGEAGTKLYELHAARGFTAGEPADWGPAAISVPGAGINCTITDAGTAKRITRV